MTKTVCRYSGVEFESVNLANEISHLAYHKAKEIAARKEEVLEAFVAKYGYQPDEMVICEQPSTGKFWVEKRSKWISIKDRLPSYKEVILVYLDNDIITEAVYRGEYNKNEHIFRITLTRQDTGERVTHWQSLPEAPK